MARRWLDSVDVEMDDTGRPVFEAAVASGLPTYGSRAVGSDGYVKVLDAPARQCHVLHAAVENNGAIISLDGGVTDHFAIPPNTERLFPALTIASGAAVHAKNLASGANYTNLRISVW